MNSTFTTAQASLRRACRRQVWLLVLLVIVGIAATVAGHFCGDYLAKFPTTTF